MRQTLEPNGQIEHEFDHFSLETLSSLYHATPVRRLDELSRIVVFSDLHLGDGGRTDDFVANSDLFLSALRDYYADGGYTLVLNGDIEELQRFCLDAILRRWSAVYEVFDDLSDSGRLLRIAGNHDLELLDDKSHRFEVLESLRYSFHGHPVFIFHGHQTSKRFQRFNRLVGLGLKYVANPLRITNSSVAHDSLKRFRTEERVYDFASRNKVLSIIGHTHRPLFESMSKLDATKFEIERLCRKYPKASPKKKGKIERAITGLKGDLKRFREGEDSSATVASLYNANFLVPCMFNSGTVIGRRGMTCLEIQEGHIALVHWFDETRSQKYLQYSNYRTQRMGQTSFHRVVIKDDSLDYIFTRINLLSG